MLFQRFVEIGRVVLITYGADYGKLAVIVDVLDQNRLLIDGPAPLQVTRQVMPVKRVALLDYVLPLRSPGVKTGTLAKVLAEEKVQEKFAESAWGKKLEKKRRRAEMNDLDRFKVMLARKKKAKIVGAEMEKLKA